MKTVQIPSPAIKGAEVSRCLHVPFHCKVELQFMEAGLFARNADGDDFSPVLPQGLINPGQPYLCSAPDYDVEVFWRFAPLNIKHPVLHGTILVDPRGTCSDTKDTPCPGSESATPLAT